MTPTPAVARAAERIHALYCARSLDGAIGDPTDLVASILTAELSPLIEALAVVTKERDEAIAQVQLWEKSRDGTLDELAHQLGVRDREVDEVLCLVPEDIVHAVDELLGERDDLVKERDAAVSRAIAAENFPPRVRDRLRMVKWKDAGHHCEAKSAVHAVLQMIAALLPARGEGEAGYSLSVTEGILTPVMPRKHTAPLAGEGEGK